MKRQIRKGAFDCNSSSMHSLVVTKNDEYITKEEAHNGVYFQSKGIIEPWIYDIEFGRSPFKVLGTFEEKVYYALASLCRYKGDEKYNEICSVVKKYIPEFADFKFRLKTNDHDKEDWTEEEIIQSYGVGNYFDYGDRWLTAEYNMGYVDEDILSGFLQKENISIEEFLTNKKYVVVVDGDEYCIYKHMKKYGLINADNIEKEYN